ncbi:MAG: hypothetical protein HRT88_22540, partial [Lentisphaeraceae bacterium]|nr:hypothetical protein [Lentisphaeraceae bacterium]
LLLLDVLSCSGLSSEKELCRYINPPYELRKKFSKLSSDYKAIKSSSLFKELNNFNPIILPENSNEANSFLNILVGHAYSNSKDCKELIEKLKAVKEQTFGVKYVATLISSSHAKDVYKFLDSYLSEFLKRPKAQQDAFINALAQVMAVSKYRESAKNPSGPFAEMLTARAAVIAGEHYREFLKKEVAEDQYGYPKAASSLVNQLVESDYEKAKKVFVIALKKLRRHRLRNYSSRSSSVSEELFNQVRHNGTMTMARLKLLQDLMPSIKFKRENHFSAAREMINTIDNISSQIMGAYCSNKKTKDEARYLTFKDTLKSSVKLIVGMDFPAVIFFRRPLNDASEQELDKILNLLKENKSLTAVAKTELLLYAQFSKDYRKNRNTAAPKELLSIYSKYCDDENIKLEIRLQAFTSHALKKIFRAKTVETNKLFFKACNLLGQSKNINVVSRLLNEYMDLLFAANDKAAGWQPAAKSLVKALELYYKKSPSSFNLSKNWYNYYSVGLLELYCATGNTEKAQSFINKVPRLKQRMETYFILLKHHQVDLAIKLFKQSYKHIDKPTSRWTAVCKGDINAAQKKFLVKMADDKDAVYTAKLYLAFVKNIRNEMSQVAGLFAAEGPQNKNLRKKVLGMLLANHYTKK